MYVYKSPIGRIEIRENQDTKIYSLFINGEFNAISQDVNLLVEMIYYHTTCDGNWESMKGRVTNVPFHISQWEKE